MSGFANEAYIVVTLNLLSLELKCNNPEKRTVTYASFGRARQISWNSVGFIFFLMLLIAVVPVMLAGGQRRRRGKFGPFQAALGSR